MKSTGIIRRIDDLGRIIIPKEIRRTLNIREGDPLEMFVADRILCLQKYYAGDGYKEIIQNLIANIGDDIDFVNSNEIQIKLNEALEILNRKDKDDDSNGI